MKTWYGENCKQCKGLNEPYMVTSSIWKIAGVGQGFLCITCLESNLGRKLKLKDFISAPINEGIFGFDAKTYLKYGKPYLEKLKNYIKRTR